MQEYRVRDGSTELVFTGELLAGSSSDDGRAQRWTELKLYRTDSGKLVLHKVGCSAVYHRDGSTCTQSAGRVSVLKLDLSPEATELVACRNCEPVDVYEAADVRYHVLMEQEWHSATVSDKPQGIIEALQGRSESGVTYLPRPSRRLLEDASEADAELAAAWRVRQL